LSYCSHLDYFNNVFNFNFSGANGVRQLLDFIKKYLNLCFEDERKSYRVG